MVVVMFFFNFLIYVNVKFMYGQVKELYIYIIINKKNLNFSCFIYKYMCNGMQLYYNLMIDVVVY